MAEFHGKECVCCADQRPQHGLRLVFTASTNFSCPPAICTMGVILNKLYHTVYATYFCKYAVGQLKDSFYCRGKRKVRYYVHCHCSRPGSLQCMAATQAMVDLCKQMQLSLLSSNCLPTPAVCCNSWLCCPLKSLGMVRSRYEHYFVFQMSEISSLSSALFQTRYRVDRIPVHANLVFIVVYCDCRGPLGRCVEKCAAFFNYLRVIMCCSYDRFDFGFAERCYLTREDFEPFESAEDLPPETSEASSAALSPASSAGSPEPPVLEPVGPPADVEFADADLPQLVPVPEDDIDL